MSPEVIVKDVLHEHGGIYCFRCGAVLLRGKRWVEIKSGEHSGWQGCPGCCPEPLPPTQGRV